MQPKTLPSKSPDDLSDLVRSYAGAQLPKSQPGEPVYPKELGHLEVIYQRNRKAVELAETPKMGGPGER